MNIQVHTWIYGTLETMSGMMADDMKENILMINKEGTGIFFWPDGRIYEGEWKDDKQHWHNIVCKRIFIFSLQL